MAWLVGAERVRRQRIAGGFKGTGARSAAQGVVFAVSAASFELGGIVQRSEDRRVAVDIGDAVFANIADHQRQESGRADVAGVGDEHDAVSVANSEAAIRAAALDLLAGHAFGAHPFQRDAPVGRSFGGRDGERGDRAMSRRSSP